MLRIIYIFLLLLPFCLQAAETEGVSSNKSIVEQFYTSMTKQEYKTLDSLMAPHYQIIDVGSLRDVNDNRHKETTPDINKRVRLLHRAIPGLTIKIEQMVAEGNKVMVRTKISGEQKGPYMGIAPTGKILVLRNFVEFTIENGKITRAVELWNELGVMKQMGYVPLN